jgi:hypothetical protein
MQLNTSLKWEHVYFKCHRGEYPEPKVNHQYFSFKNKFYIIGGENFYSHKVLSEVHVYHEESNFVERL